MRLSWVTTRTFTSATRDAVPEPDTAPQSGTAQQPTSEMNQWDWIGVLEEICQKLREYTFPAGRKPCPCLKEGDSDGAAVEQWNPRTLQPFRFQLNHKSSHRQQPLPLCREGSIRPNQYAQLMRMRYQGPHNQQESWSLKWSLCPYCMMVSIICKKTLCNRSTRLTQPGYFRLGTLWVQMCNWIVARQGIWGP